MQVRVSRISKASNDNVRVGFTNELAQARGHGVGVSEDGAAWDSPSWAVADS